MRTYDLLALLLVLAIPLSVMAVLAGLATWARDVVSRAPLVGAVGVVFTAVALAHLLVARTCGAGVNRPIVAIAVNDEACRQIGLGSLALVLLLLVTTAVVVRLGDVRR